MKWTGRSIAWLFSGWPRRSVAIVFHIASRAAILSFIVVFGVTKAMTNDVAGRFADRLGRKQTLIAGWLAAVPVPFFLMWARVLVANALSGINQGLAWSITVVMKIDVVGPQRRGWLWAFTSLQGMRPPPVPRSRQRRRRATRFAA